MTHSSLLDTIETINMGFLNKKCRSLSLQFKLKFPEDFYQDRYF